MNTRLGRLLTLIFGCGLIIGALFFIRARRLEVGSVSNTAKLQPEKSGEIYHQRIQATKALLGTDASGL